MAPLERKCGNCKEYIIWAQGGASSGICRETREDKYFYTDASNCPNFVEVEEIITDTRETLYHPQLRSYTIEEK